MALSVGINKHKLLPLHVLQWGESRVERYTCPISISGLTDVQMYGWTSKSGLAGSLVQNRSHV